MADLRCACGLEPLKREGHIVRPVLVHGRLHSLDGCHEYRVSKSASAQFDRMLLYAAFGEKK